MPTFELFTNVARDAIPENLLSSLTEKLAKATGKPAEYIAVHIMPDQMMSFGGTTEPCALCNLKSIGKIGGPQNRNYTNLLSDILQKELHIPPNRNSELHNVTKQFGDKPLLCPDGLHQFCGLKSM